MIKLIFAFIVITIALPVIWFFARRRVRWRWRGLLDIGVSALYFALIFGVNLLFAGALP